MPFFIAQNPDSFLKDPSLTPEDTHHLLRVLRAKVNDSLYLTNNQGAVAKAIIQNLKPLVLVIESTFVALAPYPLTLALPLIEKKRFEFCIEKLTELNVEKVQPLLTERTQNFKWSPAYLERLKHIAESAQKQSHRAYPLTLLQPISLKALSAQTFEQKWMAEPNAAPLRDHKNLSKASALLVVGPEGGWSLNETTFLKQNNFKSLGLGPLVLRTETAAIVMASLFDSF